MNVWEMFGEGNEKPTPHEKFKQGVKRAGYDMDAGAKRLEDLLAKQKAEREAREKQEKTNEEFTGYWKGTDKSPPGRKMVGGTDESVSEAQREVDYDDDYQDMVRRVGEKAKAADALRAQGKEPQTKFNPKTGRYYVDHGQDKPVKENAEELSIGDPVVITGDVRYKGETGDIDSFGDMKRFVVVNLYNHGKHSFHSSDVSFNDYAGSDEEESRMQEAGYGRNRGYTPGIPSPHAPTLGGRGRREDDEGWGQETPVTVWYILADGKLIKDKMGVPYHYRDKEVARKAAMTMMSKSFNAGKKFVLTTKPQDNPPENEAVLHTNYKRNRFKAINQRDQAQNKASNLAMNRVNDEVDEGVAEGDYEGMYSPEAIKMGNHFIDEFNLTNDMDQQLAIEIVDNCLEGGLTDPTQIRKQVIKYLRQSGTKIQSRNQGVAEGFLNESAYEEAWELISQPVPEIQQFVKQLGLAQDDTTAKQIAPMIDATPDTQLPAASIPKLKNLANKGNDVQTLKAIQQISGRPDAAQQYAKIMQSRDAGEGRQRGYDVSGLINSVKSGNYEAPVLLKLATGTYVIGGRTRLYAALALGIPAKVKIISVSTFVKQGQQGMAETTGDKPFDNMMKTIKQGTNKQKTADRKEQQKQTQQRARDAFGNMFGGGNPADKLSIRKGMAEGSELKQAKRKYNQAAKDANTDQVGAGKKIDTMKKSLRQKDLAKQGFAEGKKKSDTYHIVNKDGKPANLASYADKESAVKDRDAKHQGAEVRQLGPRGKVKGVSEAGSAAQQAAIAINMKKHNKKPKHVDEERTETKNEKGEVTSWRDESDWRKVSKDKDGRGRVTNLSDKARRETEKLKKEKSVDEGQLDEGVVSRIASMALGMALAVGAGSSSAEEMWVYQDANTQKLRIAMSLQKVPADALMSFKVDTDNKTVSMIKGNQETPVQVQPAVVKQAQQQAQSKVEPNVTAISNNELSKFSLKNGTVRFGMPQEEFQKIADGKNSISVGGVPFFATFDNNKLVSLTVSDQFKVSDFQQLVTDKYGKANKVSKVIGGPNKGEDGIFEWNLQDVNITVIPLQLNPVTGRPSGTALAFISLKSYSDKLNNKSAEEKIRNAKDFEESINEGWKSALGGAALAGAMALGGGAHAQSSGEDFLPEIVAHVTFKVNGNTVTKDINLGNSFKSPGEASAALQKFLKAKGIKFYDFSIERVKPDNRRYLEKTPAADTGHYGSMDSGPYSANGSSSDYMAKESIDEAVDRAVVSMMEDGYEFTEEKVRLDPKCWTGKKIGNPKTKMKGGVRVNNCVPK